MIQTFLFNLPSAVNAKSTHMRCLLCHILSNICNAQKITVCGMLQRILVIVATLRLSDSNYKLGLNFILLCLPMFES